MISFKEWTRSSVISDILVNLLTTIVFIIFISLSFKSTSDNAAIQDDTFKNHFQSRLILKSINGLNNSRSSILKAIQHKDSGLIYEAEDHMLGAISNYHVLLSEQAIAKSNRLSGAFEVSFKEIQNLYEQVFTKEDLLQDKQLLLTLVKESEILITHMFSEEAILWANESAKLHAFSQVKEKNLYFFYGLTLCFFLIQIVFVYFTIIKYRLNKKIDHQQERLILQTRLSTLGMMSAELAHEINSPLMVIDGRLRILTNEISNIPNTNEKLIKNIDIIKRNSKRIQDIIKSFKTMSKSGQNDEFEPLEISLLFEEVKDLVTQKMSNAQVELIINDDNTHEIIDARRVQIVQVLTNLINNSIDAIKNLEEPWIRIETKVVNEDTIQLLVTDSGPGIEAQHIMNIFDPFYSTKSSMEGTGLGLSISKKIMKEHGGDLNYNKDYPHTQFILTFVSKKRPVTVDGPNNFTI